MNEYGINLGIYEGNAGQLRTDGTFPYFFKEGACP
jgi:hypothetical protein